MTNSAESLQTSEENESFKLVAEDHKKGKEIFKKYLNSQYAVAEIFAIQKYSEQSVKVTMHT